MLIKGRHSQYHALALAFDKDGTIIGNAATCNYIFQEYTKAAHHKGYDIHEMADRLFGVSAERIDAPLFTFYSGEAITLIASSIWLTYGLGWPDCRSISQELIEECNANFDLSILYKPNPGAIEAIRWFSERLPVGIATSDSRKATERMISWLGLENEITAIACSEEVPRGKPSPDILLKLSQDFKIPVTDFMMIGDHEVDAVTAASAGAKSIIVGKQSPLATDWVEDLEELLKLNRG
jgi:phosphoglycolate phosphatase-like HAD superfamily hydrolase